MKTSVGVVSIVVLGSVAGYMAGEAARGEVADATIASSSPGPALLPCHRAGAPVSQRSEKGRTTRHRLLPARTLVDVTQLEAVVRARMPDHDVAVHRELAKAIDDEARAARLDPLLILALIHVESAFDPSAVSYAGAVGLMQLRQRTLHHEIERSGLASPDPLDPVANVRAGIRYLRRLVSAFGSTDLALMAYNAGPNRILSYHRAGEIPERFQAYPRRIRSERERLRTAIERPRRPDAPARG